MPQYVLKFGGIKTAEGQLEQSADPDKPTVLELSEKEAKKMGHGGELQLLSEYEAERAGEKAGAKAKAESLQASAKAKADAAHPAPAAPAAHPKAVK